jgi:hypothetical protein
MSLINSVKKIIIWFIIPQYLVIGGGGRKTILDFRKRLVNALSDAKLNNTKVEEFLDWMEHTMPYFDHNEYSGAIMITSLRKTSVI